MYILDPAGNLYAANSTTTTILTGITDFGVTTQNQIYAISNGATAS